MLGSRLKSEVWFEFSCSSGPGGQNVNRNRTRATACFMPGESSALTPAQKHLVLRKLDNRINSEGILQVSSEAERSQGANKEKAFERLVELINQALIRPKVRRATKPRRGSVEKRLQNKKARADIKKLRGKKDFL